MDEKLKQFITGIGALAETTKIGYDSFVKTGFSNEQALYLAGEMMKATLKAGFKKDKPNEED
jgi:hypothetical protein